MSNDTDIGERVDTGTPATRTVGPIPGFKKPTLISRYGALAILVMLVVVFSVLRPDTFPTYNNFTTLLSTQTVVVILALGALVPLVCGEFDLSVGYVLGFTAMQVAVLSSGGTDPLVACVSAVLSGAVIGLANGLLVAKVGINAFVATLGSGTLLSGLTVWMSGGEVIFQHIPQSLGEFRRSSQRRVIRGPTVGVASLGRV